MELTGNRGALPVLLVLKCMTIIKIRQFPKLVCERVSLISFQALSGSEDDVLLRRGLGRGEEDIGGGETRPKLWNGISTLVLLRPPAHVPRILPHEINVPVCTTCKCKRIYTSVLIHRAPFIKICSLHSFPRRCTGGSAPHRLSLVGNMNMSPLGCPPPVSEFLNPKTTWSHVKKQKRKRKEWYTYILFHDVSVTWAFSTPKGLLHP